VNLKTAYRHGARTALVKLAINPPTQVDEFVNNVESGKDVPPSPAPAATGAMSGMALDGTSPLALPGQAMQQQMVTTSPPTPQDTIGSTVGDAPPPPPSISALSG
jgi:hypothetical protein